MAAQKATDPSPSGLGLRRAAQRLLLGAIVGTLGVAFASPAAAQAATGMIRVDVTDSSGAKMPGVLVIATTADGQIPVKAVTDKTGTYVVPRRSGRTGDLAISARRIHGRCRRYHGRARRRVARCAAARSGATPGNRRGSRTSPSRAAKACSSAAGRVSSARSPVEAGAAARSRFCLRARETEPRDPAARNHPVHA